MTLSRTSRLRWLACLAGAVLLGACSAEDLTGAELPGAGAVDGVQEALGDPLNIALGKPTSQSSTDSAGASSRAVDGNTDGYYGNGSVTHTAPENQPWWQVDLQGTYPLVNVVLYNRTDCCSERLWRFRVRVSDDGVSWEDYPYPGGAPQRTSFAINRSARYVRVQLDGAGVLSLAEVEVFSSIENLALGKPALQSSTYWGGGAPSVAVDGNANGHYHQGSVTHTNFEPQAYWQVDLLGWRPISNVVLYNRTDCCSERLQNFRLRVSMDGVSWQDYPYAGVAGRLVSIAVNRTARYVRVQLDGTDALSLAEVQVFPSNDNLAFGRPALQSTTDSGGVASRAVDGNTSGYYDQRSVTHTVSEAHPWWQVDLQSLRSVSSVVLYNRTDCCSSRLQNFRVRVSEDGASWHDYPFAGVAPQRTSFAINRAARYVRVELDGAGILSLAEVEVFGSQQPVLTRAGNSVYGYWSSSGGMSPSSTANRQLLVDFEGPSETVTFKLSSPANAYLYLLDANGNVLAQDDNSGGGTDARISRVLSAGRYKLVAATASPGQGAEFTLSADKALLKYPQRVFVQPATQFLWVYDDYDSGADNDVAVWRPNLAAYPGYYSLGDVGMPFRGVPPQMAFVVTGDGDTLARPVDYSWIWSDWGSGGAHDVTFWDPVPPAGYTCLGTVTALGYSKPSTDLIRCLRSEYVLPGTFSWLWNDSGSGADYDVGLWQAEPKDHRGLALSTFKGQGNYNGPDLGRAWVLNKSATANVELQGRPVDGQTALQFAPRVWLHPEEYYFPSSVEFFLPNVHVEGNNLVTNQPLGCDSCTDPQFLDGQRPDQNRVPMYVEIVQRTQGGQPTNITDLIYWSFYPYNNGKRVCIGWYSPWGCAGGYSTFGNHVGDWEHMTVRFVEGRPHQVYLSQHSGGQTFFFGGKELALQGWRPEVYAALGSHGLYPDAARHIYENLPNGDFLADDTGRGIAWDGWVQPVVFNWKAMGTYTGSLDWLNITSDWGNPASGCSWSEPVSGQCVLNGGPTAPMKKTFSQPEALVLE